MIAYVLYLSAILSILLGFYLSIYRALLLGKDLTYSNVHIIYTFIQI